MTPMSSVQNNGNSTGGITGKGFSKGKSGNPGGRPKTSEFAEQVRNYLRERDGKSTRLEKILHDLAANDPKTLLYYAYGKPVEMVELTGQNTEKALPDSVIDAAMLLAKTF